MPQANDIIELIEKLENPNVNIDQAKCLKVRNRNHSCARCAEACAGECIGYEKNRIFFDATRCLGCLSCTAVCPTGALSPKRMTDAVLLSSAQKAMEVTPGQVVFGCDNIMNQVQGLIKLGSVAQVKCLAVIDVSLMVYLAAKGAQEVVLVSGNCENCERAFCQGTIEHAVETANVLLETWNASSRVKFTDKLPASTRKSESLGYDETRRSFFTDIRKESRNVAVEAGSVMLDSTLGKEKEEPLIKKLKVTNNGVLPLVENPRRTRLLAALDSFGMPQDVMISTDLWSQVVIDLDKCKACQVCATFCPSGALFKFHTESGKIGVKQVVRECINCRSCEEFCLHGALVLESEVFACDIAEGTVERYEMEQQKSKKFASPNRGK